VHASTTPSGNTVVGQMIGKSAQDEGNNDQKLWVSLGEVA
jgi:hypothetical protein